MAEQAARTEEAGIITHWRWRTALFAGLLVGTLDIIYILTLWTLMGVPQLAVLQAIASGILGREAFDGGMPAAMLGLALHYLISGAMALAYLVLAPGWIRARPLLAGPGYGLALWLVMNFIVVPLSAAPIAPPPAMVLIADFAGHVFLVGLPIAVLARARGCRFHGRNGC